MWAWLKDEGNQRVLMMLGGVIAFLWTAGWGVYVYRNPPTPPQPKKKGDRRHKGIVVIVLSMITTSQLVIWAVGLAIIAGAWVGWKAYVGKQATYYVCMGEHKEECRGSAEWVPCSTNIDAFLKTTHPDMCIYIKQIRKLSDVSGNRCGYATFEYLCSTRPR